ncbi:MAG: hypothetical protein WAX44_03900 [Minisyncoccia bacterium]
MTATPIDVRKFYNGAVTFLVIRGHVHWSQGGSMEGILRVGQTIAYKKHGTFSVEYAGRSYAIIHHTTVRGEVRKVFIPPQKRLWLSDGHYEIWDVNYQSFLDAFGEDGQRIPFQARRAS